MRSLKFPLECIFFAAILLSLCGCPYDSEVPLTRSEDACIDLDLVGNWLYRSTDQKDSGTITFSPFNEHEFLVILQEKGVHTREYYRAMGSNIDGDKFLNVQGIRPSFEKKSWTFVNYSVSQGELKIRIVEDKLFKEKFTSSVSLSAFIKTHLKDKDLYGDDGGKVLTFVKEVSPRPNPE